MLERTQAHQCVTTLLDLPRTQALPLSLDLHLQRRHVLPILRGWNVKQADAGKDLRYTAQHYKESK